MRKIYRILDANFNRAREALRVAEEYGRFVLDDASIAAMAKTLRSELQLICQAIPATELLAGRDTDGDVGTTITSVTEGIRERPGSVAAAACKRLTEALRAIEEYAKLAAPEQAGAAERLRYRAYAFEQQVGLRVDLPGRFRKARLYVLLTCGLCKNDPIVTAHAAIDGGADCIQLREKDLSDRQLLTLARRLRSLTLEAGTLLIVNDRPDIAALARADGVHVGQDDLPVDEARRVAGADRLVGLSTHTPDQARAAAAAEADYIGVGPMYATPTKAATAVAGPDLLRYAATEIAIPHVAIGGVTAENVGALAAAGCDRVAVCQAIIAAADPKTAARRIKNELVAAAAARQ